MCPRRCCSHHTQVAITIVCVTIVVIAVEGCRHRLRMQASVKQLIPLHCRSMVSVVVAWTLCRCRADPVIVAQTMHCCYTDSVVVARTLGHCRMDPVVIAWTLL